ncbi:MAG: NADH-quinone oxidoreductase subunit K [Candidatus Omnitrophota bacterium]
MSREVLNLLWMFGIFASLLFIIGIYCILATYNLIRALIGIEIMIKAVTLLLIVAGYVTGRTALIQALVITTIVIEAVLVAVTAGVILGIHRHTGSLDTRKMRDE